MTLEIALSLLFFTLLGVAYVKGYDWVKRRSPQQLPQFYLLMATVRFLLVVTFAALCVLFTENREEAIRFVIIYMIMYATMMVVTLKLRH